MSVVQHAPVEYVEESSFGSTVSDPSMKWIGLIRDYESSIATESRRFRDTGGSAKISTWKDMEKYRNEMPEIEITYAPQDFTFLQYFTGADGSIADDMTPIQIGENVVVNGTDENRRLLGCFGQEWEITIGSDSVAEVSCSLGAIDFNDFTTSDYIGSGSHATADSSSPFSYDDLGTVEYGGTGVAQYVDTLTMSISNRFKVMPSSSDSKDTKLDTVMMTDRRIQVGMNLTMADTDFWTTVTNYNTNDFKFTVNNTTFTLTDVEFPDYEHPATPTSLLGYDVTSDPVKDLGYS